MHRIAVTFALPAEFANWRREGKFASESTNGYKLHRARIGESEVRVLMTGIGCRSDPRELQNLLSQSNLCIASGLAGGLRPQYPAGSVLVAESVISDSGRSVLSSDKELVQIARRCGAIPVSCFLTADRIINSPREKRELSELAGAVDMESFQVLSQAQAAGVPAVAIRALSDAAAAPVPFDFNPVIDERGQIGWVSAAWHVAKMPTQIPQLIRFARESSRAARNLSHFLNEYVKVVVHECGPR